MADIVNRSPFIVEVDTKAKTKAQAELTKQFAYKAKLEAIQYAGSLIRDGHLAHITQLETSFQVRVREKGVPAKSLTFPTYAEADAYLIRVESDQKVGLFRDYFEGAKTTTAHLIQRYITEECPGMKGGDNYIVMLQAMLEDSENKLRQRIEQRKREMRDLGKVVTPLGANREPMTSLEWLHLPLTKVRRAHSRLHSRQAGVRRRKHGRPTSTCCRAFTTWRKRAGAYTSTSPCWASRPSTSTT